MTDDEFEDLLHRGLAPPAGPADPQFVARVGRAVAETERYRRWRRAILGQLGSEALALVAVAGSLGVVAQAPPVRALLAEVPALAWAMLLALAFFWLLLRSRSDAVA